MIGFFLVKMGQKSYKKRVFQKKGKGREKSRGTKPAPAYPPMFASTGIKKLTPIVYISNET